MLFIQDNEEHITLQQDRNPLYNPKHQCIRDIHQIHNEDNQQYILDIMSNKQFVVRNDIKEQCLFQHQQYKHQLLEHTIMHKLQEHTIMHKMLERKNNQHYAHKITHNELHHIHVHNVVHSYDQHIQYYKLVQMEYIQIHYNVFRNYTYYS